jgi:hypothetical protein
LISKEHSRCRLKGLNYKESITDKVVIFMKILIRFFILAFIALALSSCVGSNKISVNAKKKVSTSLVYSDSFVLPTNTAFNFAPTYSGPGTFIAIISPALPTGLSFDNLTGTISGTPTQAIAQTVFTVTAQGGSERSTTSFNLIVDGTPPQQVVITDDGESQLSTDTLNFSWTASADAETGVSHYEYSVGSSIGGSDIISPTITTLTSVNLTDLSLDLGESYYIQVKTVNGAGLERINSSDGIYIGVINDRVWLGAYYSGDNSYQINGAMYCTTASCTSQGNPGLGHFTGSPVYEGTGTNTKKVVDSGAASLLLLQSNPAVYQTSLCSNSGCSLTTLAYPRLLLTNNTFYGYGYFCNIALQSCSQVSSFTPYFYEYNSNRVYQASDGVWASSSTSTLYFLNSTDNSAQLSTQPWANNMKSDSRVSGIWGVSLSAPNYLIRKCINDGTCVTAGTAPTAQGTITMELEAAGLGTWVLSSTGYMRFCDGSTCTLLGSTFGVSADLIKDKDGTGVFFKSGGSTKLNYCSPTACTEIFTGGSSISFLSKKTNEQELQTGLVSGAFARSSTNQLLYCSTTSCTLLKTFAGENFSNSIIYSINNTSSKGVWIYTGNGQKTDYCSDTSCSELTGGNLGGNTVNMGYTELNHITAAKFSSNSWILASNELYRCSTTACSNIYSLGAATTTYPGTDTWTFFNTK